MKTYKFIRLLLGCVLIMGACSDDKENQNASGLEITSPSLSGISSSKATLTATLSGSHASDIIKRGFCYSTEPDATIYNSTSEIRTFEEDITGELTGLQPNTTYYVKAFATVYNADPVYSSEITFTTSALSNDELLANYVAPGYNDNYTDIAGWDQRNQWNLANVHDPTVMKADDGYYYMYQTDATYGNAHDGHGHFHARRSKDLVYWEYLGATMDHAPAWVKTKLNEIRAQKGLAPIDNPIYGYWAPVARKIVNGRYRMYYSIIIDNYIKTGAFNNAANFDNSWVEHAFIGMMETTDPASNVWVDKGFVVCSSSDKGINDWGRGSFSDWNAYFKWNAIDPTYIITKEGEHWLLYGSWHSGLVALQVNGETGKPLNELSVPWNIPASSTYGQLVSRRGTSRWQGSEGPEIIYNPETDYYYLFVAYDGLDIPYNTRVCRSRSITGPYLGIDGTDVTAGGNMYPVVTHPYRFISDYGWVGISHCAIFNDGNGNWYYASQGRLPADVPGINVSNALMMGHIRSIRWTTTGWPIVMPERYSAVPQAKITESELIGEWEHIDMSYKFGTQKEASTMTFASNHKITSGIWKGGTWSYDADNQILTANGVPLYIQREVNWESHPRVPTIVYAGYNGIKTYWGKKAN